MQLVVEYEGLIMSIETNMSETGCKCRISNMSDELFNDALYYREMANSCGNFYLQWRYRRSAIISFCASAEAWMNSVIKDNLEKKTTLLNNNEQQMLNFITNYNSQMPPYFNNVRNKLYNFIPKSINGSNINWNTNQESTFEKYIELSNMRNSVIHYAISNYERIYSQEFIELVGKAPEIIDNLFRRYDSIGSTLCAPAWYKQRKSRIIKG